MLDVRRFALACALGAALGCSQGDPALTWNVRFADATLRARAAAVRARVLRGGCAGHDAIYAAEAYVGSLDWPRVPSLQPGAYGLEVRASDASCVWVAAGCQPVTVPLERETAITVVLEGVAPLAACPMIACTGGTCASIGDADAGVDASACATECGACGRCAADTCGALPPVTDVSTGAAHTCVVRGALECAGDGRIGQLGAGDAIGSSMDLVPVAAGLAKVSAGTAHTCAVGAEGALFCWGANESGQLGTGSLVSRVTPAQVGTSTDWRAVSAGGAFTCGLRNDDSVWCWGANGSGQLGVGVSDATRDAPSPVGLSALEISTGDQHACVVQADGALLCWGGNGHGQLGLGDLVKRLAPVQVGMDRAWASIACGGDHTCATRSDGSLWCWGRNVGGELGVGDSTDRSAPLRVGVETSWGRAASGRTFTCALRTDRSLWCWGRGDEGMIGTGDGASATSPVRVGSASDWIGIECGDAHVCGFRSGGALWCWGMNDAGQLGLGDTATRLAPETRCP